MQRLFALCAASGVGKSTVINQLKETTKNQEFFLADGDSLGLNWHDYKDSPNSGGDYLGDGIARAVELSKGKDIVLATSLCPDSLPKIKVHDNISEVIFVNLVCDDEILTKRLKGRPLERGTHTDEFILTQIDFMNYFRRVPHLLDKVIDTSKQSVDETVREVEAFLTECSPL